MNIEKIIKQVHQECCSEHNILPKSMTEDGKIKYTYCCEKFRNILQEKVNQELAQEANKQYINTLKDIFKNSKNTKIT